MTADHAQRADAVFKAALDVEPERRPDLLDRECADDAALRSEVEAMLRADAEAGQFLEPPQRREATPLITCAPAALVAGMKISQYRIIGVVGSGGMGTVYEAMQEQPKRRVALKVLKSGLASPSGLRRFTHEAEILARLRHPGIAQVYEAGTHADPDSAVSAVPFFAMEFVDGARMLTKYVADQALSTRQRLDLFVDVCDAVQHGHQRGIIHRDLKPGNILVDQAGQPKIIDFGVARATDADVTIASFQTDVGELVGTLRYMSPEQCEGESTEIDIRSDVYALGVVLYELLAGQLPYDLTTTSPFDIPRKIRESEARRLSTIDPSLRGDLETIALKALEKDKTRRYQSVAELAADVRRYLNNEPIEAKRDSGWYVLRKTISRHRVAAVVIASFVLLTTISAIALGILYGMAERRADALRRTGYFNTIALAQNAYEAENTVDLVQLLSDCPRDLRGWEWRFLNRLSDTSTATLRGHTDEVLAIAFSPDGSKLASGGIDQAVMIWDAPSRTRLRTLTGHTGNVASLAFSPDGAHLVSASFDATARIWSMYNGEEIAVLTHDEEAVTACAYSPEGGRIATGHGDGAVRVWDEQAGSVVQTLTGHEIHVVSLAWYPDGHRLLSASWDGTIRIWDVESGSEIRVIDDHDDRIYGAAVSPDGTRLVSCSLDRTIRIFDATTGEQLHLVSTGTVFPRSVVFNPVGDRVTVSKALSFRTWDVATAEATDAIRLGHLDIVRALAVSPDGSTMASASSDKTIKLWSAEHTEAPTLHGHSDLIRSVDVSPDGMRIASAGRDGTVRIWDAGNATEIMRLTGHEGWVKSVDFTSDGSRLVSGAADRTIRIWDTETAELLKTIDAHDDVVRGVSVSPDDRLIASASWDNTARVWDARSGEVITTFTEHSGPVYGVNFSPDGRAIVSTGIDAAVRVWDVKSGIQIHALPLEDPWNSLAAAFSPDGRTVAAACGDWTVRMWDAETGQLLHTLTGHQQLVQSVAFSSDGARLVSGGFDHLIKMWDTETGKVALTIRGHGGGVPGVAFAPDGRWFVSASNDRTLRIWDAGRPE